MTTTAPTHSASPPSFEDEVRLATPGESHLERCIQCGTCSGACPSGRDMDHSPRGLFALIRAGNREKALRSNTQWYCVSCYLCMARCPQEIHVTDVMYTLKRMAIRAGYARYGAAPDFSKTFIFFVEHFGRSFEMGLAALYHGTHTPWRKVGISTLALDLAGRNRLAVMPKRIKGLHQLQAILAEAKAISLQAEQTGGTRLL